VLCARADLLRSAFVLQAEALLQLVQPLQVALLQAFVLRVELLRC
jgi:hypothetical protein